MNKSVIIIGGGIAGLAAGCYARMNGYEAKIFEMHDKAGGLCTSWKRKGYVFDGSLHWLVGSAPGCRFHEMWRELGAVQGRGTIREDEFIRIHGRDGKTFVVYKDLDRLERHMRELAPADSRVIGEIVGAIRKLKRMDIPSLKPGELYTKLDIARIVISMLPLMGTMNKYGKLSLKQLSDRLSDPFLREALNAVFDIPGFPATAFLVTMAWFDNGWQAIPAGGSLEFARAIERRYKDLGGDIAFRTKVEKVHIENDAAAGVVLEDGTKVAADAVIAACDGHEAIFGLLDGKYVSDKVRTFYGSRPVFPPGVQVSLGIARDLSHEPYWQAYQLDRPAIVGGVETGQIAFRHYCHDPSMAPKGKSAVISFYNADYGYWEKLAEDRPRYEAEKGRIAELTIGELEKRYPGIRQQVEVVDVATPMTYVRYTGNWQGSYMGWMNSSMGERIGQRLPGLRNFYMAGMWTMVNGGVPTAALTGRGAVELLCTDDGKKFVVAIPKPA